jgi:hypothetical protein
LNKVRVTGHDPGDANANPWKVTVCHEEGSVGTEPEASATTRGDRVKVLTIWRASGPVAVTSTPIEGA